MYDEEYIYYSLPRVPKKAERRIFSTLPAENVICSVFLLLPRINGFPQNPTKHRMEGLSRHNSSLTGCKIQRNLKMTVFQEMVIESKLLNLI